ncbi:MAG: hypothetical protein KF773_10600 [Deltaproteobacteria bacterium]|nr:hypothetical protein [Deltaproteobacteria bacterium]
MRAACLPGQMQRPALCLIPLLLACGGGPADPAGPDAGEMSSPHAPVILSFGTNVTTLTEGQTVTFTVVLTDPDGIDDLIGGTLTDETGEHHYGAFATSSQEGAYSLALSWDAIQQVEDITFKTGTTRKFTAEFFDTAGHSTKRSATLQLTCDGRVACEGRCRSVCGFNSTTRGSCTAACASRHAMACFAGDDDRRAFYGPTNNSHIYRLATCDTTPPATDEGQPFRLVECECLPST